jgi:hypothetical protein
MTSEGNGASKQKQVCNVEETPTVSLVRVSGIISKGIKNTTQDVHMAENSSTFRVLQSTNHQKQEERGMTFKRILMSSLDAVELVVGVGIHGRVLDAKLLPGTSDIDSHPHVGHAAANSCEHHVAILLRQNF